MELLQGFQVLPGPPGKKGGVSSSCPPWAEKKRSFEWLPGLMKPGLPFPYLFVCFFSFSLGGGLSSGRSKTEIAGGPGGPRPVAGVGWDELRFLPRLWESSLPIMSCGEWVSACLPRLPPLQPSGAGGRQVPIEAGGRPGWELGLRKRQMTHTLLIAHWCQCRLAPGGQTWGRLTCFDGDQESGLGFPLCQSPSLSENFHRDPKAL